MGFLPKIGNVATNLFHQAVDGIEHAVGVDMNNLANTVGKTLQSMPGGSAIYDGFEHAVDSVGTALHVPGFANTGDDKFDGQFLNPTNPGQPIAPNTPLSQIPAVLPNNGRAVQDSVVFVNGIGTSSQGELSEMQSLANTGLEVYGIHNATDGGAADVLQSAGDETDIGQNKAVDSVRELIVNQLSSGQSLHLVGHSQGGLIIERAIRDAIPELKQKTGLNDQQVTQLLGNLKVEDFGTAGHQYPAGPKYVHYVADGDPVPNSLGITSAGGQDGPGGKLHMLPWRQGEVNPFANHNLDNYFSYRRPFDQAYADSQPYAAPYKPAATDFLVRPPAFTVRA